jgi:hypothetical protein
VRRRRDELAEEVAQLTYDVGGLTYEMAIRDHFGLDPLVRRAAVLRAADAELGEVDRLLGRPRMASPGRAARAARRRAAAPATAGAPATRCCSRPPPAER